MCKDKEEPCDCGCPTNLKENRSPHDTPIEAFVKKLGIGPGLMVKFKDDPIEYYVKNLSANPARVFVYNPKDPSRIYNKDVTKLVMSNRKPVSFQEGEHEIEAVSEIHLTNIRLISKEEAFPHQYEESINKDIKRLESLTNKNIVLKESIEKTYEIQLEASKQRMLFQIEKELETIRAAAADYHPAFKYQTLLYTYKKKIEEI